MALNYFNLYLKFVKNAALLIMLCVYKTFKGGLYPIIFLKNIFLSYFRILFRQMIKSIIKPFNALLAGYSFIKSTISGEATISGMPVTIGIEPTNHCNLNCPECLSGSGLMTRKQGFMETGLFDKIVTELEPYILGMSLYFQGEPMLHPQFFSFLKRSVNINTTVATNGHFLSAENAEKLVTSGLKKLVVSLDGMDQANYSAYRVNGELDVVIEGIRNVSKARKKHSSSPELIIQFIVNRQNEHQIPEARNFANKMSASLKLKSMQIINGETFEKWLPVRQKYRRYEFKEGRYAIRSRLPDRCARLWFNPVITWDGKVLPCCFDKNADHVMGDMNEASFREIWNGPKYRIFRKSILSGRNLTDICRNCTSGIDWQINC
jgi:radical SAM protein with 4Fe4S-binding SPASM domain